MANALAGFFQDLFARHAKLVFEMDVGSRYKHVNSGRCGVSHALVSAVYVLPLRPRQTGDGRLGDSARHIPDRVQLALGRYRKPSLHHVNAERLQLQGDLHFFVSVHGCAGRLFAVPQRGVEYQDSFSHLDSTTPLRFALTGIPAIRLAAV